MIGLLASLVLVGQSAQTGNANWANVGADKGASRFTYLAQINWQNVKKLKVAWTYHTGEEAKSGSTIECTPIVIDGVMYITTVKLKVVALDAATGHEIWTYDPFANGMVAKGVNRGVGYWSDEKPGGARRIIYSTNDGRLISLDAKTGIPDDSFGNHGFVDLRAGIERDISKKTLRSFPSSTASLSPVRLATFARSMFGRAKKFGDFERFQLQGNLPATHGPLKD